MITDVELINFKQHQHLRVALNEGLIGLKGANEAGKSSLLHAINYAFFGAKALPLSLAETVTWGQPENSLKVRQSFLVDGVKYQITRGKSGAELVAPGLLVTGQSEVTKYVEGLFKVNADSASKLMIASQGKLRGALESREAVPLIEKLASIDLIENLITKMQAQLPCGPTKQLTENLEGLLQETKPTADFGSKLAEIELLTLEHTNAVETIEFWQQKIAPLDVKASLATVEEAKRQASDIANYHEAIKGYTQRLEKAEVVFVDNLQELYEKAEKQKQEDADLAAFQEFSKFVPPVEEMPEGTETTLAWLDDALTHLKAKKVSLDREILVAELGRINEKSCALCGKMLQDVPEVVAKNFSCDTQASVAKETLAKVQEAIRLNEQETALRLRLEKINRQTCLLQARISKWTELREVKGMSQIVWAAPVPVKDPTDYVQQLEEARVKQAAQARDAAQRQLAFNNRANDLAWIAGQLVIDKGPAEQVLEEYGLLTQRLAEAEARKTRADSSLTTAKHSLALLKAELEGSLRVYEANQAFAAKLKQDIAVYDTNNALIKRLREARPIVASRLWATVLQAISYYFSSIRGTPTVITMSDGSFRADGRPVEGLSGSTLDSLGLAIRIALSKTFLPSLDFLLLDEPAQGMDDERESAMLGVLASAEYKQVVVVTHSSLADAFASDIIQL